MPGIYIGNMIARSSGAAQWTPQSPTGLILTATSDTVIKADWTNVDTTGAGAKVYISTDNITFTLKATVALGVATANLTGLTAGTLYYVYVVSYKGSVESTASNKDVAVTEATALRDGNTVAWYDTQDLNYVTKDANDFVSEISDKLASGNDLVQATGTSQYKYRKDGLRGNGLSTSMLGSFAYNQPHFIYMLMKQITWSGNFKIFDGPDVGHRGNIYNGVATPTIIASAGTASAENSSLSLRDWHVIRVLFNGANSKLQIDATAATTGNFGANNMTGITLGASFVPNGWANNVIREIIMRGTADDAGTEAAIYNYLVAKKNAYNAYLTLNPSVHTQLASLPVNINQHGFESCNGKLYAIGGVTLATTDYYTTANTKKVYEYDPVANSWATKTDLPIAEAGCQSPILRAVGNKLYFIGGLLTGNTVTNKCFEYDPVADTWTEKTAMPTAREDFGSAVLNGKIHCFGGLANPSNVTPTVIHEIYDPATDTWDETKADLPIAKWAGDFGVECNGKLYAISGSNTMTGYPVVTPVKTVYEYDPVGNAWATKTEIPNACMYKECISIGNFIYVFGGQPAGNTNDPNKKLDIIQKYDTVNNTWEVLDVKLPYNAFGSGVCLLNGDIYFSGGGFDDVHNELYKLNL